MVASFCFYDIFYIWRDYIREKKEVSMIFKTFSS